MCIIKKRFFSILFINLCFSLYGQKKIDITLSYDELADGYYLNELKDSVKAKKYASIYLTKAKQENDSINTIHGYYFLSSINYTNILNVKYADSILFKIKDKYDKFYPAFAYINKASYYYNIGKYNIALDNYFLSLEYAKKTSNFEIQYSVKKSLGILKGQLGQKNEALVLLKQSAEYFKRKNNLQEYISSLFALADAYSRNKQLDSCSYINRLGYNISTTNNLKSKKYFVLNEGANQIHKKNYQIGLDSLHKIRAFFFNTKDKGNLSILLYNLGEAHYNLSSKDSAIHYFKKMDSVITATSDVSNDVRKGYVRLIDHYETNNDLKKQLIYIQKLLKFDSIVHLNYKYLNSAINSKYDKPELLAEKETIIKKLNKNNQLYSYNLIILFIGTVIIIGFLIFNYRKRIFYKKRFEEITKKKKVSSTDQKKVIKEDVDIGISSSIVNEILKKLETFEKNNEFIEVDLTRELLAQKFGTNSKYISKIINHHRNKNFRNYINELRINYAVEQLKNNPSIRKYTIKSIAEEFGYKSAESFSSSFKRLTGLQVSYFIKKLNEDE